jgi:GNAT superfamily N-acetyltransferase
MKQPDSIASPFSVANSHRKHKANEAGNVVMCSLNVINQQDYKLNSQGFVRLRAVKPEDRESFAIEFKHLSEEARYCRCFAFRQSLSESELDMLCNVDGIKHVAIVALQLDHLGAELRGIGGARFIRHSPYDDTAELAFLVIDAWQRKRIAKLMLNHLIELAINAGIDSLRCYLLPGNTKARALLTTVARIKNFNLQFDKDGALLCGINGNQINAHDEWTS